MCYVTATELKQNLSHYLELSRTEDIYITKNNKVISALVNPEKNAFDNFFALAGCLAEHKDANIDEIIGEGRMKKCGF